MSKDKTLINEDIITNNLYEAIKICQIDIKIFLYYDANHDLSSHRVKSHLRFSLKDDT